ncbi:MAG TPA: RNA pseudouridine synthase [Chitinispirillaceae bacterium]|nr:RNA pseudouridine synthase [Chitinispirillaceae bacterium]
MNKYPGFAVIPGRGISEDIVLVNLIEKQLKYRCLVVHRIDLETSGIVLFAKNLHTHRHLNIQFERREIKKNYLTLVQGMMKSDITVNSPIRQYGSGRMGVDPFGKPSTTEIRIVERLPDTTLLDVSPHTGRRHQIRVHCYSSGHPIIGDSLYGKDRPVGGVARLMLHAYQIKITDPVTGKERLFKAMPDEGWNAVIQSFRKL